MIGAGVIGHPVLDDFDAVGVRLVHQFAEPIPPAGLSLVEALYEL
jgi:hypothetical protein